ncbi:hypothetical protein [Shewanella glacialipiscicola]|uniref:hypothetical protein n=1 Tax=Shewanella glacialipiscicola TaxID=614069 RepID=UPI003D78B8C9
MINYFEEQGVYFATVLELSSERFVKLSDGKVLDLKLKPVMNNGISPKDYYVRLKSGLEMFMTPKQFEENIGQIEAQYDVNDAIDLIQGAEYFKTGDTTFCALVCIYGNRYLGEYKGAFNESDFEPDGKEIAYSMGVNKLIEHQVDEHRARYKRLSNDEK